MRRCIGEELLNCVLRERLPVGRFLTGSQYTRQLICVIVVVPVFVIGPGMAGGQAVSFHYFAAGRTYTMCLEGVPAMFAGTYPP